MSPSTPRLPQAGGPVCVFVPIISLCGCHILKISQIAAVKLTNFTLISTESSELNSLTFVQYFAAWGKTSDATF